MFLITHEREKRRWTKTELAFKSKIHPSVIGQLESGKMFPYPGYKKKLSEALEIPEDDLFKEVITCN